MPMTQRPRKFWIDCQIEVWLLFVSRFLRAKAVKPDQPIRLVKPMFANERGRDQRKLARRIRNWAERGVINAAQFVAGIQPGSLFENLRIRSVGRADDHLRALPRGSERRRLRSFAA